MNDVCVSQCRQPSCSAVRTVLRYLKPSGTVIRRKSNWGLCIILNVNTLGWYIVLTMTQPHKCTLCKCARTSSWYVCVLLSVYYTTHPPFPTVQIYATDDPTQNAHPHTPFLSDLHACHTIRNKTSETVWYLFVFVGKNHLISSCLSRDVNCTWFCYSGQ